MSAEYERGRQDALRHSRGADYNWMRATFGPIAWIGIPLVLTGWYMRRGAGGASAVKGAKGSNPMESMMEMMMPIQKRQFRVEVKGTKFADVIGIPEAKLEVQQYVDFLKTPSKFTRLGARLPKGCILSGEPGTGKTLLAKAVAGEADVPFFSCNGADFIEIMGGSGPKRVRELFQEARESSPCIVFIDEIDGIGSRGGGQGGSVGGEENRTINQLLAELDGLASGPDAVIVLAATNFQDNIDKALLREGRFDRKVVIEMPDVQARRDLFEFYLAKVVTGDVKGTLSTTTGEILPADPNVDNKAIAKELADLTPGVSPAQVATIVNEAALYCAVAGKLRVDIESLREGIENTLIGKKQRNRMSVEALERTALHEAGHALAMWMLPQQKPVLKISVTPRGQALGYTQKGGSEFHEYQTNVTIFSDLVVMMGGRAAEDVILGDTSVGAMDDVQRATELVLQKLLSHGMGVSSGMLSFDPQSVRQGRSWLHHSESTQVGIEKEAKRILDAAYTEAKRLVSTHRSLVEAMGKQLIEKKEVATADVERLWGPRPTTPTNEEVDAQLALILGTNTPSALPGAAATPALA